MHQTSVQIINPASSAEKMRFTELLPYRKIYRNSISCYSEPVGHSLSAWDLPTWASVSPVFMAAMKTKLSLSSRHILFQGFFRNGIYDGCEGHKSGQNQYQFFHCLTPLNAVEI